MDIGTFLIRFSIEGGYSLVVRIPEAEWEGSTPFVEEYIIVTVVSNGEIKYEVTRNHNNNTSFLPLPPIQPHPFFLSFFLSLFRFPGGNSPQLMRSSTIWASW